MKCIKLICVVCTMFLPATIFAQGQINRRPTTQKGSNRTVPTKQVTGGIPFEVGETWSYSEHVSDVNVSTFFVFTSKTDVVWLFGTPFGNYFPVGFGKYNPSTNNITFSASHKLHKPIVLYYSGEDIVFKIDRSKKTAIHRAGEKWLDRFYNDGKKFTITRENRKLTPNKKLVGSTWKGSFKDDEFVVYFKTWNEAVLNSGEEERSVAYVCIGNMIAIKGGDNIDDENSIGTIQNGNEVTLCREGLNPKKYGDHCVTLYKE